MIFNFSAKNAHKIFLVAGNLRESTIANWIESSPKKKCAILFVDVFLLIWIILQFIYRSGKKKLKLFLRPSPSTARKSEGERESFVLWFTVFIIINFLFTKYEISYFCLPAETILCDSVSLYFYFMYKNIAFTFIFVWFVFCFHLMYKRKIKIVRLDGGGEVVGSIRWRFSRVEGRRIIKECRNSSFLSESALKAHATVRFNGRNSISGMNDF